ncbi:helix-turn-helix domain-containing protein, partial [Thermus antranikianii]
GGRPRSWTKNTTRKGIIPTPDFRELLERLEAAVSALERMAGTGRLKTTGNRMGYSVAEVAELLGLSKNLVYRAIHSGNLRAVKLGGRLIVSHRALEEWLGYVGSEEQKGPRGRTW